MSENNTGNPIFVLGQEYLLDFTQLLSKELEKFLLEKWGEDWFEQCAVREPNISPDSMNDLSFLMRQILDLNNHNFRVAMAMSFFGKMQMEKPHLTALEMIRKSRNFWAHPNRLIKLHDLNKLAFNIRAIIPASEPLAEKCARLLSSEEKGDDLSVIASMTAISELFRNKMEYRSEMAKSIKEFTNYIKQSSDNEDFDSIFVAQNHMLKNLLINFLIMQPIFYQLQLDRIVQIRDSRTGSRILNHHVIVKLQQELDAEAGIRMATEFAESVKAELGDENCDCGFCVNIAGEGPVIFREDSQKKIDDIHESLENKTEISELFGGKDISGMRPDYFLLIAAVCAARSKIPAETVWKEWNFDVLNPSLDISSDAFIGSDVLTAAIKLVAIRNGISPSEVETWDYE
jgi:hypothetical protein